MNQRERKEHIGDMIKEIRQFISKIQNTKYYLKEKINTLNILQMMLNQNSLTSIIDLVTNHIEKAKKIESSERRTPKLEVWTGMMKILKKHLTFIKT